MPNITRIKNNQITDATITFAKIASGTLTGALFNPALTLNSNVTILGNLSVTGNTSTINSTNTLVNDPLIVFNNGYAGVPTYDVGMIANRNLQTLAGYGSVNTAFVWKEADAAFVAIATTETGITTGSITNSGWANVKVGNLTALTTTTGGLQAVAIGNVTPGTGAFTTASTTGNLTVGGDIAVTGNIVPTVTELYDLGSETHAWRDLYLSGFSLKLGSTTITAGAGNTMVTANANIFTGLLVGTVNTTGYVTIGNSTNRQALTVSGNSSITITTAATSTTTGALQVAGGVGIAGALYIGGNESVTGTLDVTGATTLTTATTGGLQAVAIGNVTPGTGVFTTGTFNTASTGGLQAVAIGNVTPGSGAFTTGTFSSTLGVTGATTLTTGSVGGLQAVAIGNVTPGSGVFTTVTGGSFQGIIGNAAATTAFFTTANATTLQAATIGNVGTAFTGASATLTGTFIATTVNAATIGNASAVLIGSFGNITTINATNVNAVTIGNIGAVLQGDGGNISNLSIGSIGGTVSTANVSLYANVTNSAFNSNFYVAFTNASGGSAFTGNTQLLNSTLLNFNPSTGTLAASAFSGGSGSFTTVTAGSYQGIIGNATPAAGTFTSLTTQTETVGGLQAVAIGNVTPGSGAFTTGTFSSTLGVTGATTMTTATTGGLQAVAIGNTTPGSGAFTTVTGGSFQGIIGNATATTAFFTTANATTVNAVTIGNIGAVLQGDGGNISNLSIGSIGGTVATANVAMYENIATSTTNAVYYAYLADKASGNVAAVVATGVNVNPSTSTVSAMGFVGGTGAFTTLSASGATTVTAATQSTSSGTGALVVTGGAGIGANLYVGGNTTIIGNLTVVGTTTAVQSTTLDVSDLNITVAKGAVSAAAANGAGLTVDGASATLLYTNATDTWNINKGLVGTTITTGGLQAQAIGNVTPGTAAFTTATAGSLQGIIGNVSATTAFFTTANATNVYAATVGNASTTLNGNLIGGNASLTSTTAATSTTTGALQVAGGAGIAGALYVGGNESVTGTLGVTGATTLTTATTGGLQAVAIGNATPGTGVFTTGTFNTASTGGLQAVAIGNVTPGSGVFTTGTFDTVIIGGVNALTIGNATPGTYTFTTGNVGGLQAVAIGNVTPGSGAFTTGTFNTATTGGLQAVAIGNVTPGTGIFVSVQSNAIGNVTPGTGAFTTASTTGNLTIGGNIAVTGNIVPSANVTYSLGTSGNRFKDIYLSGQTQYIGGSVIGEDESGNLTLTTATGNRLTISSVSNVLVATGNVTAPYHLGNAYGTTGTFLGSGTSTSATTGAVVVTGGVGIGGNIYVGTNAVVTGTLSVTGATTLTTGNIGGLQAVAIGNVTPGTAVFTTGTFNTATTGGLQAVAIGNVTAGTGAFTTLSASTWANITGTTAATSTTTGALVVAGGAGIAGALHVGSTATITGNTAVNNTLYGRGVYDNSVQVVSTSTGAGNLTISAGGINLTPVGPGAVTTGSSTLIPVITTDAYGRITAVSTAAVEAVAGAANVAFHTQTVALTTNQTFFPTFSNVNGGNSIPGTSSLLSYNPGTGILTASAAAINGGTASSSYTSGALIVTGGVGISGAVNTNSGITAAGKVITTNNEEATSTSTGAIQATGGISTQANLFVGNAATFNSSQTAGMDFVVRGKNDATLIWARPSASYDTVIIGNSAVAGNVIAGAKLNINTTDSIKLPVGTNAQRPGNQGQTDVQGMFRYNTTQNAVEWYTGTQWIAATTTFTVITDEQYAGDGSTVDFTMGAAATTASTIVSINGVMQIPTLAYSCSGVTLTFTEAPASSDVIDVRRLTTTETVVALNDATGYNAVDVDNTNGVTISTGTATKNARYRINTDGAQVSLLANTAVASANTATTIDTMSTTVYRSAKYTVQATNGASYQVLEALLISNGTTATVMAYGTIQTAGNLGIISATQSGSDALLQFVALNASTNVRITKEYLLI